MYLTDDDLIITLVNCRNNLTENQEKGGIIVVKENIKSTSAHLDKEDNSLIRSVEYFNAIFATAGLEVIHQSY